MNETLQQQEALLKQYQDQIRRQQELNQQEQRQQQQQRAMRELLYQQARQIRQRQWQLSQARNNQQRTELRNELRNDVRSYNIQAERVIANTTPSRVNKNWENDLAEAILKKQAEIHKIKALKNEINKKQTIAKYSEIYKERIAQGLPEWKAKAHTIADIRSDLGVQRRNEFIQYLKKEEQKQVKEQQPQIKSAFEKEKNPKISELEAKQKSSQDIKELQAKLKREQEQKKEQEKGR